MLIKIVNKKTFSSKTSLFIAAVLFAIMPLNVFSMKIDTVDELAPVISTPVSQCSEFLVSISDSRTFFVNNDTLQMDQGVYIQPQLFFNKNFGEIQLFNFKPNFGNKNFYFKIYVLNPFDTADVQIVVLDKNGQSERHNIDSIHLTYIPPWLSVVPDTNFQINFGNKLVGSKSIYNKVTITSVADTILKLDTIYLKYGKVFKIINARYNNMIVSRKDTISFQIQYQPDKEYTANGGPDNDTLIIKNCLTYKIPMSGSGVMPRIYASDFDLGLVKAGDIVEINSIFFPDSADGLKVTNVGTGELNLQSFTGPDTSSGFYIKNQSILPTTINTSPLIFKRVLFSRSDPGEYFGEIDWSSDGQGIDSISKLRAIVYIPGPYFTSAYFDRTLVKSKVSKNIIIRNSGDEPVIITGFRFEDNTSGNFSIDSNTAALFKSGIELVPKNYLQGKKEISVPINFSPQSEFYHETKVYPIFADGSSKYNGKIFNNVFGYGFLPKVKADGYLWNDKSRINITNPVTGYIEIASVSQSADLILKKIEIVNSPKTNPEDFIQVDPFVEDKLIPMNTSLKFGFKFRPTASDLRIDSIRIITNAVDGSNPNKIYDTVYVVLRGLGYNTIIQAVKGIIDFGSVLNCDQASGFIGFFNSSDSVTAYIFDIALTNGEITAFSINKDNLTNAEKNDSIVPIPPKKSIIFPVNFIPTKSVAYNYEAECKLFTNVDTTTVLLKAETTQEPFKIMGEEKDDGQYGMLTKNLPGMPNQYRILASFFDKNLQINNLSFDIVYKPEEIQFTGEIHKGYLIDKWDTLLAADATEGAFHRLHISAKTTKSLSISGYGSLVEPVFLILLSTTDQINLKIENIKTELDSCIEPIAVDGLIKIVGCGSDLKKVLIDGNFFLKIEPSEIHSDMIFNIHYAIAFDATVVIEIINSNGDIINTFNEIGQKEGDYMIPVNTVNMANGKYFIKMTCGAYVDTQSLLIWK